MYNTSFDFYAQSRYQFLLVGELPQDLEVEGIEVTNRIPPQLARLFIAAEEQSLECLPSLLRSHHHGILLEWIAPENQSCISEYA